MRPSFIIYLLSIIMISNVLYAGEEEDFDPFTLVHLKEDSHGEIKILTEEEKQNPLVLEEDKKKKAELRQRSITNITNDSVITAKNALDQLKLAENQKVMTKIPSQKFSIENKKSKKVPKKIDPLSDVENSNEKKDICCLLSSICVICTLLLPTVFFMSIT